MPGGCQPRPLPRPTRQFGQARGLRLVHGRLEERTLIAADRCRSAGRTPVRRSPCTAGSSPTDRRDPHRRDRLGADLANAGWGTHARPRIAEWSGQSVLKRCTKSFAPAHSIDRGGSPTESVATPSSQANRRLSSGGQY
jgi:hypothetical protein